MIGIAGPSGAGKSALAQRLAGEVPSLSPVVLALDCYYRDLSRLSPAQVAEHNLDEPGALDVELLTRQLRDLARGRSVQRPEYDFSTHVRLPRRILLAPGGLVIVEGLFTLHWPAVRRLMHTKVFVDAAADVCLERRIARDLRDRACTRDEVTERYRLMVRPMAECHVLPTRVHADVVVRGDIPLRQSVGAVLKHAKANQLPVP